MNKFTSHGPWWWFLFSSFGQFMFRIERGNSNESFVSSVILVSVSEWQCKYWFDNWRLSILFGKFKQWINLNNCPSIPFIKMLMSVRMSAFTNFSVCFLFVRHKFISDYGIDYMNKLNYGKNVQEERKTTSNNAEKKRKCSKENQQQDWQTINVP